MIGETKINARFHESRIKREYLFVFLDSTVKLPGFRRPLGSLKSDGFGRRFLTVK